MSLIKDLLQHPGDLPITSKFTAMNGLIDLGGGCACRKSNTHIQMMESAKKWRGHNATNGIYCSRHRRVLVD